jgi:putative ABC transport system permease protein
MMFAELLREALRNLGRHKLRSLLTALGIIFGIASVVSMVSAGEGARREILAQIQKLGTRNIILNARKPPQDKRPSGQQEGYVLEYGLTWRDLGVIRDTLPMVAEALPVHDVDKWIWFRSKRIEAKVRGVTPAYFERLDLVTAKGRTLTPTDDAERKRVCVIRPSLLREARYLGDPLRLDLKIGDDAYRVVGVLPDQGLDSSTRNALGIDDRSLDVYVPFETVVDRYGLTSAKSSAGSYESTRVELHQIVCAIADEDSVLEAARCIHTALGHLHHKRDYEVVVPLELLKSRERAQRVFDIVMPIIAGISLLVGGIGILNIMLASVSERIREIGIRRAIGATRTDITLQFLVETVTLTAIGGVCGVGLGLAGTEALRVFAGWQPVVTARAVSLSLAIAGLTGILFGIYPARRAALLDPIEALRHE